MSKTIRLWTMIVIAFAGVSFAQDDSSAIEKVDKMLLNYGKMSDILYHLLVDDNYEAIASDAQLLIEHAKWLRGLDASQKAKAKVVGQFDGYALQLEGNATNLKSVAESMIKAGTTPKKKDLRPAAAMHYGQTVMMCVSCHQTFRPVKPANP